MLRMQMAEMGRKIAQDIQAANGAQASAEAQASAAADKAKLEHRLMQLSAEVRLVVKGLGRKQEATGHIQGILEGCFNGTQHVSLSKQCPEAEWFFSRLL